MEITKEEIKLLAGLCRLGLTEKEEEKFQKELSSILGYVKQLEEADVSGVEPTFQATGLENVLREDEIAEEHREETREKILENAPQREGDYVKVRAVFERPEAA